MTGSWFEEPRLYLYVRNLMDDEEFRSFWIGEWFC